MINVIKIMAINSVTQEDDRFNNRYSLTSWCMISVNNISQYSNFGFFYSAEEEFRIGIRSFSSQIILIATLDGVISD